MLVGVCVVVAILGLRAVGEVATTVSQQVAEDPGRAVVGDCLAGTDGEELDADKLKRVACTDTTAAFKVVQIVQDKLVSEAEAACTEPSTEFYFWSGTEGAEGEVLCLASA